MEGQRRDQQQREPGEVAGAQQAGGTARERAIAQQRGRRVRAELIEREAAEQGGGRTQPEQIGNRRRRFLGKIPGERKEQKESEPKIQVPPELAELQKEERASTPAQGGGPGYGGSGSESGGVG